MSLDKDQKAWAEKLADLLANVPAGVELVIRPAYADIVPAGFERRELRDDLHYAGPSIERESIFRIRLSDRVIPVSECI